MRGLVWATDNKRAKFRLSVATTSTAIRLKHADSVGREYRYSKAAMEAEEDEDGVRATDRQGPVA